jgi:hypothetical protein
MTLMFSAWGPLLALSNVELDLLPFLQAAVAAAEMRLKGQTELMRVLVTRIGPDATTRRRMADTATSSRAGPWEELIARALAAPPLGGAAPPRRAAGDAEGSAGGSQPRVVRVADRPLDKEGLDGMKEDAVRGRQHLDGQRLVAAVAAVGHDVDDRGVLPGQGVEGGEQAGLVLVTAVNR